MRINPNLPWGFEALIRMILSKKCATLASGRRLIPHPPTGLNLTCAMRDTRGKSLESRDMLRHTKKINQTGNTGQDRRRPFRRPLEDLDGPLSYFAVF